MTMHLRIVAVLFLVFGSLLLAGGLVAGVFFGGLAAFVGLADAGGDVGQWVLGLTGAAFTIFLCVVAIPSVAAGWGLLKQKRWARTLGIILAAIALINFWIGTVFGIYALWVLLNTRAEEIFGD